jgi:hypothetical protein
MRKLDITGQRFGSLTAVRLQFMKMGRAHWLCRCECGKELTAGVSWLRSGNTTSCGSCSKLGNVRALKHGYSPKGPRTLTYNSWQSIKKRCTDKNHPGYKYWGSKGITFHKPWSDDFAEFLKYLHTTIGERTSKEMTLDRWPNPNGNYEPGNIRWATKLQQRHNRSS